MHEFVELQQTIRAYDARYFVVLLNVVGLNAFVPNEEGYRLSDVYTLLDGCQVVRKDSDAYGLIPRTNLLIDRGDEALVKILNGL